MHCPLISSSLPSSSPHALASPDGDHGNGDAEAGLDLHLHLEAAPLRREGRCGGGVGVGNPRSGSEELQLDTDGDRALVPGGASLRHLLPPPQGAHRLHQRPHLRRHRPRRRRPAPLPRIREPFQAHPHVPQLPRRRRHRRSPSSSSSLFLFAICFELLDLRLANPLKSAGGGPSDRPDSFLVSWLLVALFVA